MVKYYVSRVVFEEIPDKVTLSFSITNCQGTCKGCHSAFLRRDIGEMIDCTILDRKFVKTIKNVNCVLFLGEGTDLQALIEMSEHLRKNYNLETAIYSGRDEVEDELFEHFDYVKVGSYQADKGPLNKETTNQRLYYHREDITSKFWNRKK
jgi:anaerobic ribonucleoside-triphosphate reductase activating protein